MLPFRFFELTRPEESSLFGEYVGPPGNEGMSKKLLWGGVFGLVRVERLLAPRCRCGDVDDDDREDTCVEGELCLEEELLTGSLW